MKTLKRICLLLVIIAVASSVTFFVTQRYFFSAKTVTNNNAFEKTVNLSGKTIAYSLNKLGQLKTAEYHYTHVENYDSDRIINGFAVPFTNAKFIYSYDGVVSAGIDFSKIQVDKKEHTISITLPSAQIIGSEIDEESFKLYDERNNIFNPIGVKDINDSFANMKSIEETNAIDKGLLIWADDNAKTLIKSFIQNTYDSEDYEIIFESKQTENPN